jgi:uncharacterized DUF497 family protein
MKFEWDTQKSRVNKAKHGIDFDAAKEIWNDMNRLEIQTSYPIENRRILIGKIGERLWSAVYTQRKNATRIISVRRARKREANLYEKKGNG